MKIPRCSYRTPTLLDRILDEMLLPWQKYLACTRRQLSNRFSLKRDQCRLDHVLWVALKLGALRHTEAGYVIGKGAHVERAKERRLKIDQRQQLPMSTGPFSNTFSPKLTVDNLRKVIAAMKGDQPIAFRERVQIVPAGYKEKLKEWEIDYFRTSVARAEKRARRGILSGRYGKRFRQINMGVGVVRARKKREAIVMLPKYVQALKRAEKS